MRLELRGPDPSTFARGRPLGGHDVPRAARPRRSTRSSRTLVRIEIVIALVLSALTVVGILYVGTRLVDATPPQSQPQARGIVWGGRTFVDLSTFARWLRSR